MTAQRSNKPLVLMVLAGIAVMTVWRLLAEELPRPAEVGPGDAASASGGEPKARTETESTPVLPIDAPRVVVEVTPIERYVPPAEPRVRAVQLPSRTPLSSWTLAGTGASRWAKAEGTGRDGVGLVAVETGSGRVVRRVALRAGEVSELSFGSPMIVRGTVTDVAGAPIGGARVWLGDLDARGRPREVRTDGDGAFESPVLASDGVPFAVRADGYAAAWRALSVGPDTSRRVAVAMLPEGLLEVRLGGRAEHLELARVFVRPTARRATGLASHPFFLQTLRGGTPVDARGRAVLEGLPRRGEVEVIVLHPQVAIAAHRLVALDGERTRCDVRLEFSASATGLVLGDDGGLLAGASLLLRPGGRDVRSGNELLMLPPCLSARGCFFATSDAEGAFRLAMPGGEGDVLSVRAPGFAGRDLALGGTLPDSIVLPRWVGGEPSLRVRPPRGGSPWSLHVDTAGGVDLALAAGEDGIVALPYAGSFGLRIATRVGDEVRGERIYEGVAATGEVVLPSPPVE